MGDFLTVDAENLQADIDQTVIGEIAPLNADSQAALVKTENRLIDELIARARAKASGEVLHIRSGRLVASFHGEVTVDNPDRARSLGLYFAAGGVTHEGVYATVSLSDPIAPVLEYGAALPPHEIEPDTMHALRFLAREGVAFAARVQFPGGKIAPHPTLHAAFAEMQEEIITELEGAAGTL